MDFVVQPRVDHWAREGVEWFFVYAKLDGLDGTARYLHTDGVWRRKTVTEDGQWTGYFATRAEAQALLDSTQALTMAA